MIDLTNTDGIPSMTITESLPMVRNTDGFKTEWNRNKIIDMILKETKLSEIFYSKPAATYDEAEAIAKETESIVLKMRRGFLSGPLIREIVNTVLVDKGHTEWRNCMTRVGVSVHDAFQIDSGYGFEAKDNANQLDNAETSHKRKADKLSKEQNLLLIPSEVSELHLNGDLHVHDLEYLGTRPFCMDWDLRYFLYYGLMPDGVGKQSSIAGPAKKAEVAFLHAVKAMGSAQTNFAGGQGFYNFLTFMAPYLVGKIEEEIEQLMQMFVYEMMQMMCARGGQSLVYEERIVIRRNGIVSKIQIGELCSQYTVCIGNREVSDGTEILSLNKKTHRVEWKLLTAVHRHVPASKIVKTTLMDGRSIVTTTDHSLFTLTNDGTIEEISPASRPDKIVTAHFMGWESSIIHPGIEMSEVARITEASTPEYVYDVSVQGNENFVLANGIVAHNTVFSSVQLSPGVPKLWKDKPVVAKGRVYDGVRYKHKCTYGELEREVRLAFKALMAVMLKGDYEGKPFFFPKPEISIEPDFMQEDELFNAMNPDVPTYAELYRMAFELAAKYGTPYFDNQLPAYRGAGDGISCYQCCLADNTLIPIKTENGIKLIKIEGLTENDLIYATSSNNKWSKFDSMLIKTSNEVKVVVDEFGRRIICTEDHELPVIIDGVETKKKVVDIDPCNDFLIQESIDFKENIAILKKLPVKNLNDDSIIKLSRLFGLYAAEGSTSHHNNSKYVTWSFSSKELDLIKETSGLVKELFGVVPCICDTNHGKGTDVRAGSKLMYDWIRDNGIAMLGREMEVPPFVFNAPEKAKWAFLMGYFDGDGCYRLNGKESKQRRIEFNTISKPLAHGVILLAQSLGLNMHYGEYADKRTNRKCRYMLTINKMEDVTAFFNNETRQLKRCVKIKKVCISEYEGKVYDPVNVPGHNFLLGNGIISGNCAYQFSANPADDKDFDDKLYFKDGKHFSMGSWMVMSLNCPRAAYKADHDDEKLFQELKSLMCSAITVFKTKHEWMERLIAANRIPFASQRPKDPNTGIPGEIAVDFDALVYTIGIIGINEMVQYHTGYQIHESDDAYKLAIRAMLEMKMYAKELSQKYNMEIALARTPAETTAQRFAVSDLMHDEYREKAMQVIKGDVNKALEHINETKDLPVYYTNGTHLAPNASVTITERIQKEQIFFPIVDGGNIMHIWMGEKNPDPDGLMDFGMRIAKNTQVGYFAFTRDMTICLAEGYMSNGLQEKCPKCGSENVQHLSRITGYLQNVEGWNAGKKQELKDRQRYDVA
jgi:anaerobic ribonucleoside-triphosphate reductase